MCQFICALLLGCLVLVPGAFGQQQPDWEITSPSGEGGVVYDFDKGIATASRGVLIRFGPAVMTAESIVLNLQTGEVIADGRVRIQRDDQVWASEHIRYNFITREIEAEQFRTGKMPVFVQGEGLSADVTNNIYAATNAYVTPDDIEKPSVRVKAGYIRIIQGEKVIAKNAVLYVGNVPVFWFPYYSRSLRAEGSHFNFLPGYRSIFGPFLLSSYDWQINEQLDANLHLDYRVRRGVGAGPDLTYHAGRWGDVSLKYYYLYDQDPNIEFGDSELPHNRQRVWGSYLATPTTNLSLRAMVRYQGDTNIVREFFESEYRQNPQPSTYLEANQTWQNFSLDVYAQPRVNDFLETVERLPEVRLTGYRQQVRNFHLYYETESSVGYYRRVFPEFDSFVYGTNYGAARADTYHQLVSPHIFFSWLNFVPRVGGRFTYYSEVDEHDLQLDEQSRFVFNTGAELNFKVSRLWPGIQSRALDLDGVRHIMQPSLNYVFVPGPSVAPEQLPQFDYELPSLRLLPMEFPDYNAIDSIDSQNAMRLGLNNKIQTKRKGQVVDVVDWSLYCDWRIDPREDQTHFSDVYSDLLLMPTSWLRLESLTRYNTDAGQWRMSYNAVTLQPNDSWAWSVGHFYLRDDMPGSPLPLHDVPYGEGNDLLTSTLYYRLNENWGFRIAHRYDLRNDIMQEQAYTIYRDLRSWTAALTLRLRDNPHGANDVTVAFTFSLKAFPRYGDGKDVVRPYTLWGY